jgi:hypothetical protein
VSLAGAVVWGVVPFAPRAPFRLYVEDKAPIEVADAAKLVAAVEKGGDAEFTYMVPGKARPLLVLSDAQHDALGELLALRLARFSKLDPTDQERIRAHGHDLLFHLDPAAFPGLPEENAAMVAGLVRVHRSAIVPEPLGRLSPYELATLHERVVTFYGFNVRKLIERRLRDLAALQRQQAPQS